MPRNPEISKKGKLFLREGLFGGMSKKQLEQVRNRARETQTPYSTLEHRMVDVVCLTSHTLGQYWPPTDERESAIQLEMVIALSVETAAADDAKLRRHEAEFKVEATLHHPGHLLW